MFVGPRGDKICLIALEVYLTCGIVVEEVVVGGGGGFERGEAHWCASVSCKWLC